MPSTTPQRAGDETALLNKPALGQLIDRLRQLGYTVIGPTIADGAIVLGELRSLDQLPIGWTDEQERGVYRLRQRSDQAYFGYAVGPHSWKSYLFPPRTVLHTVELRADTFAVHANTASPPKYAFLGVRACDLHAIAIQDRTFLQGPYVDPQYRARREQALFIAVNCGQAASTCFCTSMHTGPKVDGGYDIALTELPEAFLMEVATERGRDATAGIPRREASPADQESAAEIVRGTAQQIQRKLDPSDMPGLLYENLEHPRWDDVADRCLSCTNCTMVCPTCFCHAIEDVPDLEQQRTERVRVWDSCFNPAHAHMAGGNGRPDTRSRYRQWLTHKLASWIDQFGVSGCVGCGRCITWCPVGIDITEEVAAIRGRETV